LVLEIGVEQTRGITLILEKQGGFETPEVKPDYSGCNRIFAVQRKMNG